MHIHKLHIFGKNRDAIASQKGYTFQQLKTLEDWIENRIAEGNEEIYCDYEDDILSRNIEQCKTKFKQIKLYSTDFSFSSESIKKSISHFFTLYSKGDYAFDQTEFYFETNSSIVQRNVRGNDAVLLKEWYDNQDELGFELLDRIRVRVKKILDEYIEENMKELGGNIDLKRDLQIASNVYKNLKDEDFNAFIQCIKWQFDGIESNKAVDQIISHIEDLIPKIPLPLDDRKTNIYVALLIKEVFQRSIQDDPEHRKLTKDLLDSALLSAGEKEDKWYSHTLIQMKAKGEVKNFFPGEFQTVINAARYCRWQRMDDQHKSFWLNVLLEYIKLEEVPAQNKRKGIYEYLFLKIGHDFLKEGNESTIAADGEWITYYFVNWEQRDRLQDIDDDIVLLQLLKSQIIKHELPISKDDISKWQMTIKTYLENEAAKEKRVDRLCLIWELVGHLVQQEDVFDPIRSFKAGLIYYRKIPPLLEKAQSYSLAHLYDQMKEMVKTLAEHGLVDGLIEIIDEFMDEIQTYAEKTGLHHKMARDLVERGGLHIQRHDLPNYLKALELFHRAKGKWRQEYTYEGYILSLIGIAKVYDGLGMSYASKYYSLVAFWATWHSADTRLYKRLQTALGQIISIDYKHGAWINAIDDFKLYLFTKREFDDRGFEMDNDETYQKLVFELATILYATPLIHPEMAEFIESVKLKWGFIWTEQMQLVVEQLSKGFKDVDALKSKLGLIHTDLPLNDVGPVRNIRFNAMGNEWHIQFENTQTMNPIGEEFVSFLQVVLCELARSHQNVLKGGNEINISIEQGHFQKQYLEDGKWAVTIPEFDSKEQFEINMHYKYIGSLVTSILKKISPFTEIEFNQFYLEQLLMKENLGEKVIESSSYQRIFRNTIGGTLEAFQRASIFKTMDEKDIIVSYKKWLLIKI